MKLSPAFNVFGSFFPAWLVCFAIGILFAYLAHLVLARLEIEREVKPLLLVYPSMAVACACTLYLVLFS